MYPDTKNADWHTLAPVQRREMYLLADALGLSDLAERINTVMQERAEPAPPAEARYLRGLRIAIVGDHGDVIDLRKHAESYGAKLAANITKTVKWMVSTTPDATDSRHTTARKLGIPIISPAEGSARLDEAVREAELKAYERQREIDRTPRFDNNEPTKLTPTGGHHGAETNSTTTPNLCPGTNSCEVIQRSAVD